MELHVATWNPLRMKVHTPPCRDMDSYHVVTSRGSRTPRNLVDSQNLSKEKGSLTVSKSERELRRLRSTINYNGSRSNKGGGRDRGNLLLKLK